MKITVYTITDCKFSQAEKQYLQEKAIQFEEKNLEANREFLSEMLTISNNFAGTPVTKIEKDDGQVVVLKGFTKEEFDKALAPAAVPGMTPQPTDTQAAVTPPPIQNDTPPSPVSVPPTPSAPPSEASDTGVKPAQPVEPVAPVQPPTSFNDTLSQPPAPVTPAQPAAMDSVMNQLQSQTGDTTETPTVPQQPAPVEPMQPVSQAPQAQPMSTAPQPPAENPQGNEALSSVLQDLQNRSGDNKPQA